MNLKSHLKKYYDDHENDTLRNNVDQEVTALIELADTNRKKEDLLNSGGVSPFPTEEEKQSSPTIEENKFGHLGWLDKLIDLSQAENQDILCHSLVDDISVLKPGMIVDAKDYLDNLHLSIIC